ncbi:MAG: SAM-dependent methyltransferase [Planctomycetota bacterium]|jgi:SAM-dependent methyltransferase
MSTTLTKCRSCSSADLSTVIDFGISPLADKLVLASERDEPDLCFPLRLVFCPECSLVQITENVPPEILWGGDYPYYTSLSPGLVRHFSASADALMERLPLNSETLVVEAASNDGYMLKLFADKGIPVLGVDPASGPAKVATDAGVPTMCCLFDMQAAQTILAERGQAQLILGNNVLNLVSDLDDVMRAIDTLLAPDGEVVLEVPYLVDSIDKLAFDNVFHQNTTYYSATALERLFRAHGLFLNEVESVATFGGSLRATFARQERVGTSVRTILEEETRRGVTRFEFYEEFASKVSKIKADLMATLRELKADGKRIVAYGAAGGMATTLLAYMEIDKDLIEYAVDINHHKHGKWTSGSRLEIRPAETLLEDRPDVVLLLAWNFADEIMEQQKAFRDQGGQFLVPVPVPRLV